MRRTKKDKSVVFQQRIALRAKAEKAQLILPQSIREMREAIDLTQAEFAHLFKMTRQQIVALESGQSNPTMQTLMKIGKIFGFELAFVAQKQTSPDRE